MLGTDTLGAQIKAVSLTPQTTGSPEHFCREITHSEASFRKRDPGQQAPDSKQGTERWGGGGAPVIFGGDCVSAVRADPSSSWLHDPQQRMACSLLDFLHIHGDLSSWPEGDTRKAREARMSCPVCPREPLCLSSHSSGSCLIGQVFSDVLIQSMDLGARQSSQP